MEKAYQWAVIGAGPAGIAVVGKLLDLGIEANEILWLDPHFEVGDFGRLWPNVSSNTKAGLFSRYLHEITAFNYDADKFELSTLAPENTCKLNYMAEPLTTVTQTLIDRVDSKRCTVTEIELTQRKWHIMTNDGQLKAHKTVLAHGSSPLTLNYPETPTIAIDIAMDKQKLAKSISKDDTIAVFGSSHSAIIIIRYLVELGIHSIINFYQSPCRYAIDLGDWILFDDSGLKGETATWARENIDGTLPPNLQRHYSNKENIAHFLPQCSKAIHAIGFKRRSSIVIKNYENAKYNPYTGIIAPGLFGFGIAYPECRTNEVGMSENRVGLWKFMDYLNRTMPIWLRYGT
jgi:Pyridine nucleotide-disulphide oxidoreductase